MRDIEGVEVWLESTYTKEVNGVRRHLKYPEVLCPIETGGTDADGNEFPAYPHCYIQFGQDPTRNNFRVVTRFEPWFGLPNASNVVLRVGVFTGLSQQPPITNYRSTPVARYHYIPRDQVLGRQHVMELPHNGRKVMELPCCGDEEKIEGQNFSFISLGRVHLLILVQNGRWQYLRARTAESTARVDTGS